MGTGKKKANTIYQQPQTPNTPQEMVGDGTAAGAFPKRDHNMSHSHH